MKKQQNEYVLFTKCFQLLLSLPTYLVNHFAGLMYYMTLISILDFYLRSVSFIPPVTPNKNVSI